MRINEKFFQYLTLIRLPNYLTVLAEPWVGYMLCGGQEILPLVLLPFCAMFTYAFGICLNDVADYAVDLQERPTRPLPSGAISRRSAIILASVCGLISLILSACLTWDAFAVNVFLLILCLLYNFVLKPFAWVAMLTMTCCRLGVIVLGVAAMPGTIACNMLHVMVFPLIACFFYILGISRIARDETQFRPKFIGRVMVLIGMVIPLSAFVHMSLHPNYTMDFNSFTLMVLALTILILGFRRYLVMSAIVVDVSTVQAQIGYLIGMITFFQAAWMTMSSYEYSLFFAIGTALLYFPFGFLAKRFSPT